MSWFCRTRSVPTRRAAISFPYVVEAIWEVESEVARRGRDALIDFSKLVIGSAPQKLFVAPYVGRFEQQRYLEALAVPARRTDGDVFVCQIDHPSNWSMEEIRQPTLYVWSNSRQRWDEVV
jgi:hypothetical protein